MYDTLYGMLGLQDILMGHLLLWVYMQLWNWRRKGLVKLVQNQKYQKIQIN